MTARTYSTEEAAELLGVPSSAIRNWKTRKRVTPAGLVRGRGRGGLVPTYRLEDLRAHAEAYKERVTRRAEKADPAE